MTKPSYPTDPEILGDAETAALDRAVAERRPGAERWSRLGIAERADLPASTQASIRAHAEEWAAVAAERRPTGSWDGEEWAVRPVRGVDERGGELAAAAELFGSALRG
ncbi:hypothetical protein IU433_25290 [Nocardia puris]|uniref:hypothetical protein n=1 Tax=Nocardia puris TaxID=208602 RepID=UPI001893DB6C|nr:hypothetical protein [Nocardia puris]MBF6214776.1 hypothetical protein [Nocardia puris]MBF6368750.1 hypothetical protein [Nocardia puris]MBF6462330.1 hypothetical protein [Nocardia puris]